MEFDYTPVIISIKTSVLSTVLTFFVGIAIAWRVARYQGKFKGFIDAVLSLPLVLPPTVVGFFLLLLLGKYGPIGKVLNMMGTGVIFTWSATVISATVVAFPLMYRTARGAFEQIDGNMLGVARTLGVSERRIFWRIAVPLAWPGLAAGTVLAFARSLGEFGATLMIAGNIPGKTQTIPVAIFFAAEGGDMEKAFMWVILIVLISLVAIMAMNYWSEYDKKRPRKSIGG